MTPVTTVLSFIEPHDRLGAIVLINVNRNPRLQAVKGHWDPHNIFRHRQSIELPHP